MKNFIFISILSVLFWSCGGGGDDPEPENRPPSTPTLSYPTPNLLCIDNAVNFQWNASTDPDSDPITYTLEIATNSQFTENLETRTTSSTNSLVPLDKGVAFFWRVKAMDNKNASSSYSTVNQFYTEGVGISNHLPFSPEIVKPNLSAIIQNPTTELEWKANDVDNDDLIYDVYLGTSNPPTTLVSENQSAKTYTASLTASTSYYWNIVVKDQQGGETIGQIWYFKTD